jgi:hypothetical protein
MIYTYRRNTNLFLHHTCFLSRERLERIKLNVLIVR